MRMKMNPKSRKFQEIKELMPKPRFGPLGLDTLLLVLTNHITNIKHS